MGQIYQILAVDGLCGDNNIAYNGLIIKLHDSSAELVFANACAVGSVSGART